MTEGRARLGAGGRVPARVGRAGGAARSGGGVAEAMDPAMAGGEWVPAFAGMTWAGRSRGETPTCGAVGAIVRPAVVMTVRARSRGEPRPTGGDRPAYLSKNARTAAVYSSGAWSIAKWLAAGRMISSEPGISAAILSVWGRRIASSYSPATTAVGTLIALT